MSMQQHHNEWQSLIEISGPFLSMPVLERVFPQVLEPHEPAIAKDARLMLAEWRHAHGKARHVPAAHTQWVRFVLEEVLGFNEPVLREGQSLPLGLEARIPQHGETLRPDYACVNPSGRQDANQARLLIKVEPAYQGLAKPLERVMNVYLFISYQ